MTTLFLESVMQVTAIYLRGVGRTKYNLLSRQVVVVVRRESLLQVEATLGGKAKESGT